MIMMNSVSRKGRENLLEEYKILHDSIYHRSANMQITHSVLLPSSMIILAIAIEFQESVDALLPLDFSISGFLPLFSAILLSLSFFASLTMAKINNICFNRIHEIEEKLGIKGHRYIYSRIQNTWWWKTRRIMWQGILVLAIIICFISSLYLFL